MTEMQLEPVKTNSLPAGMTWEWADEIRRQYSEGPIPRTMLPPDRESLEDYLRDAENGDIVAPIVATALIIDAQIRMGVWTGPPPASLTAFGLDLASLTEDGDIVLSAKGLARLLLDARAREAAAVADAAGDMVFVIADSKRRAQSLVRWWAPNNSGDVTERSLAGRYTLGTVRADWTARYAGKNCMVVPAYIMERLSASPRGEVESTAENWNLLQFAALDLSKEKATC
jgi:hypothetical protein